MAPSYESIQRFIHSEEYLEPTFDAMALTIPVIKQILSKHGVLYRSRDLKAALVESFRMHVQKLSSTDMPASASVQQTGVAQRPASAQQYGTAYSSGHNATTIAQAGQIPGHGNANRDERGQAGSGNIVAELTVRLERMEKVHSETSTKMETEIAKLTSLVELLMTSSATEESLRVPRNILTPGAASTTSPLAYTSQNEPAPTTLPPGVETEDSCEDEAPEELTILAIIDSRHVGHAKALHYLVQYVEMEEPSWESCEALDDFDEERDRFHTEHPDRPA